MISLEHVIGLVRAKDFDPAGLGKAIPVVHVESNSYLGAAWGEGQTCHVALDQLRRTQIGACVSIKELKPTTEADGNYISRPTDALDLPVYGKGPNARACGHLPEFNGVVHTTASNVFAIRTEADGVDEVDVSCQCANTCACFSIQESDLGGSTIRVSVGLNKPRAVRAHCLAIANIRKMYSYAMAAICCNTAVRRGMQAAGWLHEPCHRVTYHYC